MTTFKPNDRVKVVRESETNRGFNILLPELKGRCGNIQSIDESDSIHWVNIDGHIFVLCFPADMLELEVSRG